jgi:hypothetical protein
MRRSRLDSLLRPLSFTVIALAGIWFIAWIVVLLVFNFTCDRALGSCDDTFSLFRTWMNGQAVIFPALILAGVYLLFVYRSKRDG